MSQLVKDAVINNGNIIIQRANTITELEMLEILKQLLVASAKKQQVNVEQFLANVALQK